MTKNQQIIELRETVLKHQVMLTIAEDLIVGYIVDLEARGASLNHGRHVVQMIRVMVPTIKTEGRPP